MFAVIRTGGKQYQVTTGQILNVEKLAGQVGDEVIFDTVLLCFQDDAASFEIGKPYLKSKVVKAKILKQGRAKKVDVIKYKPKIRYRRKIGHRQHYTQLEIVSIG